MNDEVVRFTSDKSDAVIRCSPDAEILYWGPKFGHMGIELEPVKSVESG